MRPSAFRLPLLWLWAFPASWPFILRNLSAWARLQIPGKSEGSSRSPCCPLLSWGPGTELRGREASHIPSGARPSPNWEPRPLSLLPASHAIQGRLCRHKHTYTHFHVPPLILLPIRVSCSSGSLQHHCVAGDDFKALILLPPPPKGKDCGCVPPLPTLFSSLEPSPFHHYI